MHNLFTLWFVEHRDCYEGIFTYDHQTAPNMDEGVELHMPTK
jgi:hypothetical protein